MGKGKRWGCAPRVAAHVRKTLQDELDDEEGRATKEIRRRQKELRKKYALGTVLVHKKGDGHSIIKRITRIIR